MYKKFVINMIERAIRMEFGCDRITNIDLYDVGPHFIFFNFETIFEDCKVYGYIDEYGDVSWVEGPDYNIVKSYFAA